MKNIFGYFLATSFLVGGFVSSFAYAETNKKEFETFSKIISLSKDIPAGSIQLGVVYEPNNLTSKKDFNSIKAIIGKKFKGYKHNITLKEITPAEISTNNTPVLFVTEGLSNNIQAKISAQAKASKALTVSTDMQCVEAANCILGIDVSKGVKIIINGKAYNDSGLRFNAAFEFMAKEI